MQFLHVRVELNVIISYFRRNGEDCLRNNDYKIKKLLWK